MSATGIGAFINGAFAGMEIRDRRNSRKRREAREDERHQWEVDDRARADSAWMEEQRRAKAAEEARLRADEATRRAMEEGEAQVSSGRGAIPADAAVAEPAPAPEPAARGRGVSPSLVDGTDDARAARRGDTSPARRAPAPVSGDAPAPVVGVGTMPGGVPPEALGQPGPQRGAMSNPQQLGEAPGRAMSPAPETRERAAPPPRLISRPERGRGIAEAMVADREPPSGPVPPTVSYADAAPAGQAAPGYDGAPGTPERMGRGAPGAILAPLVMNPGDIPASADPVRALVQTDTTDDARAARGLGRSAYLDGLETPAGPRNMPARVPGAPAPAPTPGPTPPGASRGPWVEGTLPGGEPPQPMSPLGPQRGARGAIQSPEPAAPAAVRGPLESQPASMPAPPAAGAAPARPAAPETSPERAAPQALQDAAVRSGLPSVQAAAAAVEEVTDSTPPKPSNRGAVRKPTVTPEQARKAQASYIETYMEVGAPIIVEHMVSEGRYEEAAAFQEFVQSQQTQTAMKHWAKATFAAGIGDLDTFSDEVANAYNVRGYFDDGLTIVKDKSGLLRDEAGEVAGARVVIRNEETGEEFEQRFDDPTDMIDFGVRMLAPEQAFAYSREQNQKAQELRADRAQTERKRAIDLQDEERENAREDRKDAQEAEEKQKDRILKAAEAIFKAEQNRLTPRTDAEGNPLPPMTWGDAVAAAERQETRRSSAGRGPSTTSRVGMGVGGSPPGGSTSDFLGG